MPFAFGLAALAGFCGAAYHIPLAWMLGPLLAAACLSLAGVDLRPNENLRKFGQLTIGTAVGLNMTASVLAELGSWLPLMVFSALFSVLASCVMGVILARMARLDQKTAFFASLPGGLAEMGNIGMQMHARAEPIAIVHTLRVALVAIVTPSILLAFGTPHPSTLPASQIVDPYWAVGLIAGGAGFAYLLGFARLNNPYMIGAVVFTAIFASQDLVSGKMLPPVFALAQLLIGFAVGCRFRRDILTRLPRVALCSVISILGLGLVMAGFAWLLSLTIDMEFPAAMLATSPGGLSEMTVTAEILHLAVPVVVGFQVVRGVLVNSLASYYFMIFTRSGMLGFLQKLLGVGAEDYN
ncbi:AbrB family transcriptional regulator [Pseudochelatococcus sp. B33]